MKPSRFIVLTMFFSAVMLLPAAHAAIDPAAAIVKLRKSCDEGPGTPTLNNCFTTTTALRNWMVARPVTAGPLSVEIGPGTFSFSGSPTVAFICDRSNISLKGSGPDVTILDGSANGVGIQANASCINFNVQDLTINGTFMAISWTGDGGSSRWTNVNVTSSVYLWYEFSCGVTSNRAVHYWFNSRISSTYTSYPAYAAKCSENWFYGSQIVSQGNTAISAAGSSPAKPEIHVYGSTIRVTSLPGVTYPAPNFTGVDSGLVAVIAGGNGEIHIHGTGIDVIGNDMPNDIAALMAKEGGTIHANGAAYNLSTPSPGKIQRINNSTTSPGHVHAPYLWEPHITPPVNGGSTNNVPNNVLYSQDGADIAIETNCAATGCGGTLTGTEQHILIYRTACTGANGPWWDVILKKCR